MTDERVDFFFSFRSPYSYLAAPRAFALADRYAIDEHRKLFSLDLSLDL